MNIDDIHNKIRDEIKNTGDMSEKLIKKLNSAISSRWKSIKITANERQEICLHNDWDHDYEGWFMFSGVQIILQKDVIYRLS